MCGINQAPRSTATLCCAVLGTSGEAHKFCAAHVRISSSRRQHKDTYAGATQQEQHNAHTVLATTRIQAQPVAPAQMCPDSPPASMQPKLLQLLQVLILNMFTTLCDCPSRLPGPVLCSTSPLAQPCPQPNTRLAHNATGLIAPSHGCCSNSISACQACRCSRHTT